MGVQYSIAGSGAAGQQSVQIPETGAQVVALFCSGPVTIPISASKYAVFNLNGGGSAPISIPFSALVHFRTDGQTITYTNVTVGNGSVVFYFGTPFSYSGIPSLPLTAFAGILDNLRSYTASVAQTVTFTFPSGNLKITGISFVLGAATLVTFSLTTSTGKTINLFYNANMLGGQMAIIPLTEIESANTLSVSITSSVTTTVSTAMYYA